MGVILDSLSPAYGGYSIARDERVILLKGAVPGEKVDVEIVEKKRDYSVGVVVGVLEPSDDRVEPPCPVFGKCGGCHLQYIRYEKQLAMKDEVLRDTLLRLGKVEADLGAPLSDSDWNYRRRAQFKVSKTGDIGFFRESSRDVIVFEKCPLMNDGINRLLGKIKERCTVGGLSDIHIAMGDTPVTLLKGKGYDTASLEDFVETGLSGVAYNDSIAYGGAYTGFDLNGLRYTVSPWSFFQAHWDLNRKAVDFIMEKLGPLEGKEILDLYAGAGNFSLPAAARGAGVVAVEESRYAVEDGKRNFELNGIKNCRFVKSSAEKYRINKRFDIVILDPPRPGLTSEVTKKVLDNPPGMIVYISCNPATLARDLKKLREKYDLGAVHQIDFFPNTFHIESVSFLTLR
jgi:23S rRNA (uracil1939-C5)-methyltransferase